MSLSTFSGDLYLLTDSPMARLVAFVYSLAYGLTPDENPFTQTRAFCHYVSPVLFCMENPYEINTWQ